MMRASSAAAGTQRTASWRCIGVKDDGRPVVAFASPGRNPVRVKSPRNPSAAAETDRAPRAADATVASGRGSAPCPPPTRNSTVRLELRYNGAQSSASGGALVSQREDGGARAGPVEGPKSPRRSAQELRQEERDREDRTIARILSRARREPEGSALKHPSVTLPSPIRAALAGLAPAEDVRAESDAIGDGTRLPAAGGGPARTLPLSAVYHPRLRNRVKLRPQRGASAGTRTATSHASRSRGISFPRAEAGARPRPPSDSPDRMHSRGGRARLRSAHPSRRAKAVPSGRPAAGPRSPGQDLPAAVAVRLPPFHVQAVPADQEERISWRVQQFQDGLVDREQGKLRSLRLELDQLLQRSAAAREEIAEVERDTEALEQFRGPTERSGALYSLLGRGKSLAGKIAASEEALQRQRLRNDMLAHMKWRTKNEARVESDVATALERQKARIEEHLRQVGAQCGDAAQQAEDAQLRLIQLSEVADAARSERARKRGELRAELESVRERNRRTEEHESRRNALSSTIQVERQERQRRQRAAHEGTARRLEDEAAEMERRSAKLASSFERLRVAAQSSEVSEIVAKFAARGAETVKLEQEAEAVRARLAALAEERSTLAAALGHEVTGGSRRTLYRDMDRAKEQAEEVCRAEEEAGVRAQDAAMRARQGWHCFARLFLLLNAFLRSHKERVLRAKRAAEDELSWFRLQDPAARGRVPQRSMRRHSMRIGGGGGGGGGVHNRSGARTPPSRAGSLRVGGADPPPLSALDPAAGLGLDGPPPLPLSGRASLPSSVPRLRWRSGTTGFELIDALLGRGPSALAVEAEGRESRQAESGSVADRLTQLSRDLAGGWQEAEETAARSALERRASRRGQHGRRVAARVEEGSSPSSFPARPDVPVGTHSAADTLQEALTEPPSPDVLRLGAALAERVRLLVALLSYIHAHYGGQSRTATPSRPRGTSGGAAAQGHRWGSLNRYLSVDVELSDEEAECDAAAGGGEESRGRESGAVPGPAVKESGEGRRPAESVDGQVASSASRHPRPPRERRGPRGGGGGTRSKRRLAVLTSFSSASAVSSAVHAMRRSTAKGGRYVPIGERPKRAGGPDEDYREASGDAASPEATVASTATLGAQRSRSGDKHASVRAPSLLQRTGRTYRDDLEASVASAVWSEADDRALEALRRRRRRPDVEQRAEQRRRRMSMRGRPASSHSSRSVAPAVHGRGSAGDRGLSTLQEVADEEVDVVPEASRGAGGLGAEGGQRGEGSKGSGRAAHDEDSAWSDEAEAAALPSRVASPAQSTASGLRVGSWILHDRAVREGQLVTEGDLEPDALGLLFWRGSASDEEAPLVVWKNSSVGEAGGEQGASAQVTATPAGRAEDVAVSSVQVVGGEGGEEEANGEEGGEEEANGEEGASTSPGPGAEVRSPVESEGVCTAGHDGARTGERTQLPKLHVVRVQSPAGDPGRGVALDDPISQSMVLSPPRLGPTEAPKLRGPAPPGLRAGNAYDRYVRASLFGVDLSHDPVLGIRVREREDAIARLHANLRVSISDRSDPWNGELDVDLERPDSSVRDRAHAAPQPAADEGASTSTLASGPEGGAGHDAAAGREGSRAANGRVTAPDRGRSSAAEGAGAATRRGKKRRSRKGKKAGSRGWRSALGDASGSDDEEAAFRRARAAIRGHEGKQEK